MSEQTPMVSREGELSKILTELTEATMTLEKLAQTLRGRLKQVTRQETDKEKIDPQQGMIRHTPYGAQLDKELSRVRIANQILGDLIERLEI